MTWQYADMTSFSNFFDAFLFLLSHLVTGPSFISISSLVLELWQFTFIWVSSEFCQIPGDIGKLVMPNLTRMYLIKCYYVLQNAMVSVSHFWVIKGKQTEGDKTTSIQIHLHILITRFEFWFEVCLFGGVKLAKNADPDKYVYSGYCIEFNSHSEFSLLDGSLGKNVIIFGVDTNWSVHSDNKKKHILILSDNVWWN